jgi:tetratricopeptide (TPR) repeat protein
VSEDIKTLTARLAEEPASLAFLELGEALRRRGQLDAAYKVARGGLARYPALADAHDLLGRILGDQGDLAGAFDAWAEALRFDPMRIGALKGIAFLYFRAGDVPAALEHLRRAAEIDPDDPSIIQAVERVRSGTVSSAEPPLSAPAPSSNGTKASAGLGESEQGMMLVDGNGLRIRGTLMSPSHEDVGDRVAGELAGVSKEASRTARLLGLGGWQSIAVESPEGNLYLVPPTADSLLLSVSDPSLPMARLGLMAEKAAREARAWLESNV